HSCSVGTLSRALRGARGLRISWLMVGIERPSPRFSVQQSGNQNHLRTTRPNSQTAPGTPANDEKTLTCEALAAPSERFIHRPNENSGAAIDFRGVPLGTASRRGYRLLPAPRKWWREYIDDPQGRQAPRRVICKPAKSRRFQPKIAPGWHAGAHP